MLRALCQNTRNKTDLNHVLIKGSLTLSKTTNFDSSKLKVFIDDNFKLYEHGRIFSKSLENSVEKGEIARYEQFPLLPQSIQKIYTADK